MLSKSKHQHFVGIKSQLCQYQPQAVKTALGAIGRVVENDADFHDESLLQDNLLKKYAPFTVPGIKEKTDGIQ